jgi:hypothetical protein
VAAGLAVALLFGLMAVGPQLDAGAEVVPPYPDCVLNAAGTNWIAPPGFPSGTQCLQPSTGSAALSPNRTQIQWGQEVTFTYSANDVPGDPDAISWGIQWSPPSTAYQRVSGCGGKDLSCTIRFTPEETWHGLSGRYWFGVGASSGRGRYAYSGVWVTPVLYQVDVRARTDAGTQAYGGSTVGGVAVRAGTDPMLTTCFARPGTKFGSGSWFGSTTAWNWAEGRAWYPTDGMADCQYSRYINANIWPEIWPAWTFGLPAGQWDLYLWDQHGPNDWDGKARQGTPYDVVHVTVGDADQQVGTVLRQRPRPTVRAEWQGPYPLAIGKHGTVKVTVDAGAGNAGYADVRFDPAELGLTSSDDSVVEILSGPDPAPVQGGFRMFGGQQRVFTYDVVARAEGNVNLSAAIDSTDDLGITSRSTANFGLEARVVREVQLRNLRSDPQTPSDGDGFTIRGDLVNVGNVDVNGIAVTGAVDTSIPGGADLQPGATIASLAPGASTQIAIPGTLRDPLGATVRVTTTGTAADNGATVTASERLRVGRPPGLLGITVDGPREVELEPGDDGVPQPKDVTYTVTVTNDGLSPLTDVQLQNPRQDHQGGTTEDPLTLTAPWPDTFVGNLAPGQSGQVTFHYRATKGGRIGLVNTASGQLDGEWYSTDSTTRITVTQGDGLEIDTSDVPSTATKDTAVDLPIKITNPTGHDVTDIELATPTDVGDEPVAFDLVSEPGGDDDGFSLGPDESRTVRFRIQPTEIGDLKLRFQATGQSVIDGGRVWLDGSATTTIGVRTESALTWSMERRYDGTNDTVANTYEKAHPSSWKIDLDFDTGGTSCDGADIELTRTSDGETTPIDDVERTEDGDCTYRMTVSELGKFDLHAEVTKDDDTLVDLTEEMEPKDIVIVSIGDSMSSGEGSLASEGWENSQCHRSELAGPAQAAKTMEDDGDPSTVDDAHSSVTFVHQACSGANTPNGLLGPYVGIEPGSSLSPQMFTLGYILGDRKVDALLMTSGINDIHFSEFLLHCIEQTDCANVPMASAGGAMPADLMAQRIGQLPQMYAELNRWFGEIGVDSDDVYLLEYPDPSKGDDGSYCHTYIPSKVDIQPDEYEFLDEHMQTPLNDAGAAGAAANGWHRVGGVASAFRYHGLCSSAPWSDSILDSFWLQWNKEGAFHPNAIGHQVFGSLIYETMKNGGVGVLGGGGTSNATSVDGTTPAGTDEMELRNNKFAPGDVVTINPGGTNQETRRVDRLGSLIFDTPLDHDHFDGEMIVRTADLPPSVGANRPPVAAPDSFTIPASGRVVLDVLANDSDPDDGDQLRIRGWGGSDHWSASDDGTTMVWDGTVTSCEPIRVTYQASDDHGATAVEAVVMLTPDCSSSLGATVDDVTTPEGTPASVNATVTGAIGTASVSWDLDGDGQFDDAGGASADVPAPDGPATKAVAAKVTDEAGRSVVAEATVTVTNTAPTGRLVAPSSVVSGEAFTLSVDDVDDVAGDLPPTISYSCDGTTFAPSATCTLTAAGEHAVSARLDDGDGGITALTATVMVAAPTTTTTSTTTTSTTTTTTTTSTTVPSTTTTSTTVPTTSTTTTVPTTTSTTSTTTTVPPARDTATVTISGRLAYANTGTSTAGNVAVARDAGGIVSARGSITIPGLRGGAATVTVDVQRVWILPLWSGQVSVNDPSAGMNVTAPVLGTVHPAAGRNAATGMTSWFALGSFPDLIRPYTLTWTVDDVS